MMPGDRSEKPERYTLIIYIYHQGLGRVLKPYAIASNPLALTLLSIFTGVAVGFVFALRLSFRRNQAPFAVPEKPFTLSADGRHRRHCQKIIQS
jgi:hypothetical protein